jgi:hypothetical protein
MDRYNRVNHSTECRLRTLPPGVIASETTCDCGVVGPVRQNTKTVPTCKACNKLMMNCQCTLDLTAKKPNVDPRAETMPALDVLKCQRCGKYPTCECKPCIVKNCPLIRCNDPRHKETLDLPPDAPRVQSWDMKNKELTTEDINFNVWLWFVTVSIVALLFAGLYVIYCVHVRR